MHYFTMPYLDRPSPVMRLYNESMIYLLAVSRTWMIKIQCLGQWPRMHSTIIYAHALISPIQTVELEYCNSRTDNSL